MPFSFDAIGPAALWAYLVVFGLFVVLFTREVIAPASGASCDRRWRLYAGAVNAVNIGVVVSVGWLMSDQLGAINLIDLPESWGVLAQSLVVFFTAAFIAYWWHRLAHASDLLWRTVHQLHHSPSRIEALTAFYVHPLDSFIATAINAVVAYVVFDASGPAVGLALLYVGVFNLIAHADIKTPWWLGFVTQRPEMHAIHHERDQHKNNYGLPIYDLMFGTWRNPQQREVVCGFAPETEYQVKDMLLMKDVHKSG